MKMKFIAYDPNTGQKIKLIEYRFNERGKATKYYSDEHGNFVYNPLDKQLFERDCYASVMKVIIAKRDYYLIGEC
ncbi:hypothetical protein KTI78_01655 [Acinetobacter sp. WU_MDCI_Abxe161]|uniref:hypothetical protein n=1 Tax=Acinetobacter sp. WU_MDCI_Abxe161 TaxID=2850074 RepID=UPI0021CD2E8D|nr:hypothetical protein [Acinetobacter sp. WU_MDCI_Abxe161]MCU4501870.1 hypothetical protein [Acinetobacter sp. WU_MDCI_Abxe161]